MERCASLLSFDAQFNVHNSCMTELEQWTVVLPNFHLHAQNATLSDFSDFYRYLFEKRSSLPKYPYFLLSYETLCVKYAWKTCFISYLFDGYRRKTSIQLIIYPKPSLTFPFIPPCLCKFIEALRPLLAAKSGKLNGSLFNYPPIWVKLKHIFKLSFLEHA